MEAHLSIVEHITTILAGCLAIWGIYSWRGQAKWNSRREITEEVLNLVFQCKANIRQLRSVAGHPVSKEWIDRFNEPIYNLDTVKFKFIIIAGSSPAEREKIERHLNTFKEIVSTVQLAEERESRHGTNLSELMAISEDQLRKLAAEKDAIHEVMYWRMDESDAIEQRIDQSIADIYNYYDNLMNSNAFMRFLESHFRLRSRSVKSSRNEA